MLDAVCIEPAQAHRASVIWLHGLGADGHDFEPIVPELGLPAEAGVRLVFPHAPVRPVTLNGGMPMRAWYDIVGLDAAARIDVDGLDASRADIEELIAREVEAGINPRAIVLAGFSQGGALALHTALRHRERLAGLLALSTYLPHHQALADHAAPANRDLPVWLAHGSLDPVLPYRFGEHCRDWLQQAGYPVAWQSYPMGHQVCMEQIHAIGAWLGERLADQPMAD